MYDLEEIRKNISLADLAEEAGAQFNNPNRLMSHCPLPRHAGDRSSKALTIFENNKGEWKWKCHSACPSDANSGDIFSFYMAWKCVDFKTAVTELAERAALNPVDHIPPTRKENQIQATPTAPEPAWSARAEQFITWAENNLINHKGAQEYLEKERGLSPETWRAFRLGYNPTNLYDDPARWELDGKKIWLPRGIVIPGFWQEQPWYVKIRRPLPGQSFGKYIGEWTARDGLPDVKFGGPRGGISCLFRLELLGTKPVLILVEGEWDTMLLWEYCPDLCDVGTLGGAGAKLDMLDLSLLTRYLAVLVVHDDDLAGEKGREYIAELHTRFSRVQSIQPPAHDLTDFWKSGGNVRGWVAGQVAHTLEAALQGMVMTSPVAEDWEIIARLAKADACP